MSAFIVSRGHIEYLTNAAIAYRVVSAMDADGFGQMLWDQNIRSVKARYPNEPSDTLPGPVGEDFEYKHRLTLHTPRLDPVSVIKASQCYDYQSCETDDYRNTPAGCAVEAIKARAIRSLPGYEEAPWEID